MRSTSPTSVCILLTSNQLASGGEESLADLAVSLTQLGHQVSVGYFKKSLSAQVQSRLQTRLRVGTTRIKIFRVSREVDSWWQPSVRWHDIAEGRFSVLSFRYVFSPFRLLDQKRFSRFDLIIASQILTPQGVFQLGRLSKAKLILNHAQEPENLLSHFESRAEREKKTGTYLDYLDSFAAVLFQTGSQLEAFEALHPTCRTQTLLLKPGVDERSAEEQLLRFRRGKLKSPFDPDKINVVQFGKISKVKGQGLSIDAVRLLAHRFPSLRLHLVGRLAEDEEYGQNIGRMIQDLGLERVVKRWGHRPDHWRFLLHADLLLISSTAEGAPRILREAMFARIPAVVTPLTGILDMVSPDSAFISQEVDAASIGYQIESAIGDPIMAKVRADKAHEHFRNQFSRDQYLIRFQEVVDELSLSK